MKLLLQISLLVFSFNPWYSSHHTNDSRFEFSKSVFKVKGIIKKADGNFIIVPEESKEEKFVPTYLPDEYKKNGLEVTFDGDLGTADKAGTALNIHKIWVAYELKEKYKLIHKSYDLN